MQIKIKDFAGMYPKIHPTQLPESVAQNCMNVVLNNGILTPVYSASAVNYGNAGWNGFKSVVQWKVGNRDKHWFNTEIVRFAFSPVNEAYRLYWTYEQRNAALTFRNWTPVEGSEELLGGGNDYKAGLPAPNKLTFSSDTLTTPPVAPVVPPPEPPVEGAPPVEPAPEPPPIEFEARSYVVTYRNMLGDESAPSLASEVVYATEATPPTVVISLTTAERDALNAEYGATGMLLYRTVTDSSGNTDYYFVTYLDFSTMTATGLIKTDRIGAKYVIDPIATKDYDQPRVGMHGLGVTDYGIGYAYKEKIICLAEPYVMYAWPRKYELTTPQPIVAMGHYSNAIVVATDGNPILIIGLHPDSMSMTTLPLYEGCVSSRSMVNVSGGCIYASNNGLVMVSGNSAELITKDIFSPEDWQNLNPKTIFATQHNEGYLFFYDNGIRKGSCFIDIHNLRNGVLFYDGHGINAFVDYKGQATIIDVAPLGSGKETCYYPFNPQSPTAGKVNKRLDWHSKTFRMDRNTRMLAGQVIADNYNSSITFSIYVNRSLLYTCNVTNNKPFRIKNHSAAGDFSIKIESNVAIREVSIGETMRDLST